jgi:anti-sigma factor RsiW
LNVGKPITEDDLHGHVDAALDPERLKEVTAYLLHNPDAANRTLIFSAQRTALRESLRPVIDEPVPLRLDLARRIAAQRYTRRQIWRNAAAVALLLGSGGAAGWWMRGLAEPPENGLAALAQEAVDSYTVFATDRTHPVELQADQQDQLLRWVASRLHRNVAVPDLSGSGYRFMGGRIVTTSHGPAGFFLYDDRQGTRLALLMRPMVTDRTAHMSKHNFGDVAGYVWADAGFGYSVIGAAAAEELHPLANEVRRQLNAEG